MLRRFESYRIRHRRQATLKIEGWIESDADLLVKDKELGSVDATE